MVHMYMYMFLNSKIGQCVVPLVVYIGPLYNTQGIREEAMQEENLSVKTCLNTGYKLMHPTILYYVPSLSPSRMRLVNSISYPPQLYNINSQIIALTPLLT